MFKSSALNLKVSGFPESRIMLQKYSLNEIVKDEMLAVFEMYNRTDDLSQNKLKIEKIFLELKFLL